MQPIVQRFFSIRPGEGRLLQWLSLLTFTLFFFLTVGYSAVDSLFMAYAGGKMIPYAWTILGALAIPITPWFTGLTTTASPPRLFIGILAAGAVMMTGMWIFAGGTDGNKYLLYYAVKELYALFLLGFFWTYLTGFLDSQQAKRFVPVLGAVWSMGDFFGGRFTGTLARTFGTEQLFLIWGAGTLLLIPIVLLIERRFQRVGGTSGKPLRLNLGPLIARIRSTQLLTGLAVMSAMFLAVGIALRYQYYGIFGKAFPNVADGAAFLGNLRAYVSVFKVAMGLFLLPRLVSWLGVRNVLLVYPIGGLIALVALAAAPGVSTASLGFFIVIGIGQAVYDPALSLTFNVLSPGERTTLRAFFNGIMNPTGALAVCGSLILVNSLELPPATVTVVNLTCAAALLAAVLVVRKSYVHSVLQGLRLTGRFQFDPSGQGRLPKELIAELESRWDSSAPDRKKVILEFFSPQPDLAPEFLEKAATDPEPSVRTAFLVTAEGRWILRPEQIVRLLGDPDAGVRAAAARYAGSVSFDDIDELARLLTDPNPSVRTEAAVSLWSTGDLEQVGQAVNLMSQALKGNAQEQTAALNALGRLGDPKYLRTIAGFALHTNDYVRLTAARAARRMAGPAGKRSLHALAIWLRRARGEERHALIQCVAAIGGPDAAQLLFAEAEHLSGGQFFRMRDAIQSIGKAAVAPGLGLITDRSRNMEARILALSVLNHVQPPDKNLLRSLARESLTDALRETARARVLQTLTTPGAKVLALLYQEQADLTRTFLVRCLFSASRVHGVRWVELGIRSTDRASRANAIEALLNLAPSAMRDDLTRLLEADAPVPLPTPEASIREALSRGGPLWKEAAEAALASLQPATVKA